MTELALAAADGYRLAASVALPDGEAPRRVVLVAPATGVRRRLYRPFAEFLAARGAVVLTWDWRGVGESRPPRLRGFRATMRDWGEQDLAGAIHWAGERFPGVPRVLVGHSFGGQAPGLAPNAGALSGALLVGAQSGYWGHWPGRSGWRYLPLWYLAVPALTRLFGYFPAAPLGLGEDLPAGVALQWARWCRSPGYLGDWSGHARFRAPLLAYSFADDDYAPREAVAALLGHYGSEVREHRHLAPAEVGAEHIGHFGFFRPGVVPSLWAEAARWMEALPGARPAAGTDEREARR